MKYGDLYIIPNENKIGESSVFYQNNFNYSSNSEKLKQNYYSNYYFNFSDNQDSSIQLICDGNLVVKILNSMDMVIFYIPEFITDNQKLWIDSQVQLFLNYSKVKAYELSKIDGTYQINEIRSGDEVSRLIGYRNFLYHKSDSLSGRKY